MRDAKLYDEIQELWGAFSRAMGVQRNRLSHATEPPPAMLQLRAGMAESPAWYLIQAAEFDPEPLTVAKIRHRDVYASERLVAGLLELMASERWFDRSDAGDYVLTEDGRYLMTQLRNRPSTYLADLEPIPYDDIAWLEEQFHNLIQASVETAVPPGNWCLLHSRRRAPAENAPNLAKLFQYVADFNAFRDDCHMNAWQPLRLEGYEWEAFSHVASGATHSAEGLFRALAHRGYSRADYHRALKELVLRDWLTTEDNHQTYHLTLLGKTVQGQVEQRTDSYFYTPWAYLNDNNVNDLRQRLRQLLNGLNMVM